jgi:hypothetical protein
MFKHYFELIQDIEIWPIISLVIFFLFFVIIIVMVIRTDRTYVAYMESLPFEEDELNEAENRVKNINT